MPQCTKIDDIRGGNHLSLIVTPGGYEEWIWNVVTQFTPRIGQSFATLEECIEFYQTYVDACGFEPRLSATKRFRDSGDIKTQLIVCNRQGYKDKKSKVLASNGEEEEISTKPYYPRKTKLTMVGCKAKILFRFVIKEIDHVKVPLFVVDQFHASHNHLLCPLKYKEFLTKSRNLNLHHQQTIIDNCKVNIGPTTTFRSYKEYVDGYENVGAYLIDFKNFGREVKCFIGERDGQMFIEQFEELAATRRGFYYAHDGDDNDYLYRIFWADTEAHQNYSLYGQVVSFDPTYGTNRYGMIFCPFTVVDHHKRLVTFGVALINRENNMNFKWLFEKFIECMGGKEPNCFFTNQCPTMKIAVPAIFKSAAHHYFMWHIMSKLPEKVGPIVSKEIDFLSRMNAIVWDTDLEPSDFEAKWSALISEFQLEDNAWLIYMFNKLQRWIPAYYRDIPLGCLLKTTQRSENIYSCFKRFENSHGTLVEFLLCYHNSMDQQRHTQKSLDRDSDYFLPQTKTPLELERHASNVYTHELFYEFQKQFIDSLHSWSARNSSRDSTTRFINSEDGILHTTYTVAFNPTTFDAKCSCKMFERKGYICKHIIWIMPCKRVKKIPEQ